ncbi:MAG TPA: GDSL-type esterase/lipase family protein [Candidatus Sulfotelmatobacter sp.]|nr:GDSL-type esterase/lipase family protein [Candidatus Sulfotelmatobacter sp.]
MDSVRYRAGEVANKDQKVPVGTAQSVEGKFGKAVQFSFTGGLGAGFLMGSVPATAEWDRTEGFSFYVKGDGSTNWGGLELIDKADYGLRYGYCFPLESTEWRKVVVRWSDLTPELAAPLVDAQRGYAPSHFGNLWFGKWFYWREYPAHSFAIDQVVLEEKIPAEVGKATWEPGLTRVQAKLKARQPITVVTMGDSLSDKRHWANQQTLWSEALVRGLTAQCGSSVKLINPAIGGTTLSQNIVLMPRWLREAPSPDLVTVWFGFNDWDSGVRGERFKEYLRLAVERIRRQTRGSADVLLLTTNPAFSRWDTMKEMEQAARAVAQEQRTGLVDIAAEFRKAGSPEQALQQAYWAWDKTHLGTNGHQLVATTLIKALYATP